ncbi:hypothetical protein C5S31_08590 [ANME-1 cluster archaeon GoMg2]|nr:hypothetical protein [ANME-1 cluster archaeon GoMg2]
MDTGNDTADFTEFDVPTPGAANVIEQVLTTIEVSPSTATLNVSATEQFTATAKDQDGNVMSGVVINWTSSNVTVGTITDAGLFTALVVGTTTVMAANGTVNGTAAVTVQSGVQPVLTTIEVSPSTATLNVSATEQFTATAKDQDGNVMSGVIINWTSSNETVGTITDAGLFTALVVGTTTVTAANETVNGTAAVTVQEVVPQNLTTIEVSPSTATLGVNVEKEFTATAKDQDGTVMSGVVINWTSSNITIGTVSPASATTGDDGTAKTTFTALVVGTTTVKAANGTVNDTASVTVQITPLNIADLKAEPNKYVNTANPTKVSAKITSGAGLELVTLYAIDTKNYQSKQYTLYAEDIPIGGDDYSSEWDATKFKVKNATTSSGTKPVFVGKTDKWDSITYYSVLGNLTINTTSGTAVAVALFDKNDLKLSKLIDPLTKESCSVEPGNTTFTPFAVDATNRDTITDIWALLGSLEPLDAVTLTGTAPDYSISLVKTQVPDGDYTVGMAALDKAGAKDYSETTVSVGLKPTPTPSPRRRGGGGGGGGIPDTDGDGYTDIEEIIMGTDPLDPCDPNPECVACTGAIVKEVITEVITERPATPKPTPKPTIAPTTPEPKPEEPEKPPGFEAVFAIAGLLAVAYLALRRKK